MGPAEPTLKRISLLIRDDQYERLGERGVNLSGLVRDLIDDHLSDHRIIIAVSDETRALYERIVANTGTTDVEVEQYLREALSALLRDKITQMQTLAETAFGVRKG